MIYTASNLDLISVTIFHDFSYRELLVYRKTADEYYTEIQLREAVNNPSIVHFTTSFLSKRVWMIDCEHQYVDEWLMCKSISPWKENELWADNRPTW